MTTNPFIPTTSGLQPNAGQLGTPGAITATSVTSQTIALGVLSFTIQAQCAFAPGMQVSIVDSADNTKYMLGTVQSYSGTTLIVNVQTTSGAGTIATWQINLAGAVGPPGAAGAAGATGATGASGASLATLGEAIGLKVKNNASTPSTKIDITALLAMLVTSGGVATRVSAASVTIDLTTGTSTSTANGMDGEARGTSAWVYCYLINNGVTTAGLGTLTTPIAGNPTMPAGYTSFLYVGAMYVDGSGNLMRTVQNGRQAHYVVTAATNTAALPQPISGSSGSVTVPTWTAQAVTGVVPATASMINVALYVASGQAAMVAPNNAYGAYNSTTNPPPLVSSGTELCVLMGQLTLESTNIYYAGNNAANGLAVDGWSDYCVPA